MWTPPLIRMRPWTLLFTLLFCAGCDDGDADAPGEDRPIDALCPPTDVPTPHDMASDMASDMAYPIDDFPTPVPEEVDPAAIDEAVAQHCDEAIGPARVDALTDDLSVAIGFDLASTIVLSTPVGRVVFDVGMSPARAEITRAALDDAGPGPIAAVVYTHSHIDHIGGASVWVEPDTPVWATAGLPAGIIEQYGAFRPSETRRGALQFGRSVPEEALPCSALGRRVDLDAALSPGVRFPTETFDDVVSLDFGGVTVELHAAPGETDDQLFAWIPHIGAVLPGDNWYAAFPNLYTIRGTTPRDVDRWIASIDAMRRLDPEMLVPSHTAPIIGRDAVRAALTAHRDAIQWVRDRVIGAANVGLDLDGVAAAAALPAHLSAISTLGERYGQVDWSARAIYTHRVGWFDGRTSTLYPAHDPLLREIELMGGPDRVLSAARAALDGGDPRFALHLLDKLARSGVDAATLDPLAAAARTALAAVVTNTNGRAWLLEEARALTEPSEPPDDVVLDDALLDAIPIEAILRVMPSRLRAAAALDRHETMALQLDERRFLLTIRRGVAEIVEGDPLPGTPEPVATVTAPASTFIRMALGVLPAGQALAEGLLEVDDLPAALAILALFDAG